MDLVDLQIFLDGFDAGARYGRGIDDWDKELCTLSVVA